MVSQKEILEALQNGADPEALAKEITETFNQALAEKKRLDKEAERSEAEKKARAVHKEQALQGILDSIWEFIREYYPDFSIPEDMSDIVSASDIIAEMDKTAANLKAMEDMFATTRKKKPVARKSSDMTIQEFLRKNGLR